MATTTRAESVHYLPPGVPLPVPARDGLDTDFWDGTRRHELRIQRCNDCQTWQFGPEWVCHNCHSFDLGWERVSGRGRIFSWERCWHAVHPALATSGPYLVVLVELPDAGNVRLVGNLLGDPLQEVVIGSEVDVEYEDHEDAATLVQWRVTNPSASPEPRRLGDVVE
jgi:uncharacterized OB-fold protein